MQKQCLLDSSTQNHAEPLWNDLKESVLYPKRAGGGMRRVESMWEEVVGASLRISKNLEWVWVAFLHVDLHFLT